MEWNELNESQAEQLITVFKNRQKTFAWFFYIWIFMGVSLILAGSITTITEIVKEIAPISNLIIIPLIIVFAGGIFIAFPLWILKSATMREVKAIKNKTARICLTNIATKKELAQRDNKTIFYYAVCLPNNESIEVKSR